MKQNAVEISTISPILSPFDLSFDPTPYSKGKSHFQLAFFSIRDPGRKQALNDFYAFCRLVDDLADENNLELQARQRALDEIETWLRSGTPGGHPYWTRLAQHFKNYDIASELPLGVIAGVKTDLFQPVRFQTWTELNTYVQGVAGDVGEVVLHILGAKGPQLKPYAQQLGRCVQYLNIMRDFESDLHEDRIYVPAEVFKPSDRSPKKILEIKNLLFLKAMECRKLAKAYSPKCFPAEIMVNLYIEAAKKYWAHAKPTPKSKITRLKLLMKGVYRSLSCFKKAST